MSVAGDAKWRVWAPTAREVALVIGAERRAARALENGLWEAEAPPLGRDYRVGIDDRPPRPDPRSRWQPQGVHGPSQRIADDFAWNDAAFRAPPLCAGLIYEMHVGTFSEEGTYAGAARKLPHLAALGVTHVQLMPLAAFPGRHGWGYDGVALFAPHPAYGDPNELKRFVDVCHQHGLAALVDVVYNHFGPDGNYAGEFAPYFTARHKVPWGMAVNLDGPGSDEVRRFFIDNACMWLRDYHFDGLRLDAVHALYDQSACHFLEEIVAAVRALEPQLQRPLCVIAESDLNDPRLVRGSELGGYGLDAQWSDDFHHALHAALTGERIGYYADFGKVGDIARALTDGFVYAGRYSTSRARRHGRSLGDVSGQRLLGYLQNHDQVGNRPRGERIGHLTSGARVRIGAALVFVAPFVPMVFQGEEWGASTPFPYFTDHEKPELAEAVRRGRREECRSFGGRPEDVPDPQAEATYRSAILDWNEREQPEHRELLRWYTALAKLRADSPDLLDGRRDRVRVRCEEAQGLLEVQRGSVTLQVNLGERAADSAAPMGVPVLYYPERPQNSAGRVSVPADGCCIWVA